MNSLGTSAAARGGSGSARAAAQAGSEESYPREEPVCFHLICNLPFPCEHKLEMERGDGRSTDARLSLSLETAPSAEERSLLDAKFSSGAALPGAGHVQPRDSHISDIGSSPRTESRRPPAVSGHAIPQTKPLPSKGTEQTNLGSQGEVLEPPNGLPLLPERVCQGRLPRENQTKSWLAIASACKRFHATSAALN